MVDNRPIREAVGVAQVSQVVAVAPHLVRDLGVAHGWTVYVLVDRVAVLHQPLRQVADVMQHLQEQVILCWLEHSNRQGRGSHCKTPW